MSFPDLKRWQRRANRHTGPFSPHKKMPFGLFCAPRAVIDAYRFAT